VRKTLLAVALLYSPGLVAGVIDGTKTGVGSTASGDAKPAAADYGIDGAAELAHLSTAPDSPHNHLRAGQTATQLISGEIDAEPLFAAAIAGGNKHVYVPCGSYRFDRPLPIIAGRTAIVGGQSGCVVVKQNFTTGSAFTVTGGADGIDEVTINHIRVLMAPGVTKTSGASFYAINGHNIHFEYDRSDGDFVGIEFRGGAHQFEYFAENNEINLASKAAIWLTDDGKNAHQVKDVYLRDNALGASAVGYLIDNASGVYASHSDICCAGGTGVLVAPGRGQNVNSLYLTNFLADEQTGANGGIAFPNTGGFVSEAYLTDCWGSGSTAGAGLFVGNPNLDGLTIRGFNAHTNHAAGIDIEAGTNILIDGAQAFYNDTGRIGVPGIIIGGTASHVILANAHSGRGGYVSQAAPSRINYQSYGFVIGGSASYVDAHDNQTFDNAQGGFVDTSSHASTNVKHDNLTQ